jgi:hypothetical protein
MSGHAGWRRVAGVKQLAVFWCGARFLLLGPGAVNHVVSLSTDGLAWGGDNTIAVLGATVQPTAKTTSKTTAKPTATTKATAKPTATGTSATTAKPTVKPKPKPKPKPRKKIKVSPSPKPQWPPVDFEYASGIYAKIPTSKELIGVISAKGNLASQVAACSKFICGAVQVASEPGCVWWEVNSKVYAQNKDLIGNLRTITGASLAREVKTILLISPEPIATSEYVSSIEVVCHQEAKPEGTQSVTFTKVNG